MARTYGPADTWPKHQFLFWNKALSVAQSAGWSLRYVDAPHKFGNAYCPGGADGFPCSFMIDKTANGGETFSVEARKLIRNCRHGSAGPGSKVRPRQLECQRLLDQADRVIASVAEGLDAAEARQAAQAELDRLQLQIEAVEANLDDILQRDVDEALRAVYETDGAPTSDEISDTLAEAVAAVDSGESVATKLKRSRPHLAEPFLQRVLAARTLIAGLRARLEELMI
jgi:hypothetical protein